MSITVHSDLWDLVIGGYLFAYKSIINIHDFYLTLPKSHELVRLFPAPSFFFPYPPLTLLTFGFWTKILKPVLDRGFLEFVFTHVSAPYEKLTTIWHIFLYKSLYLVFDFGIAWILWESFAKRKDKKLALLLWLFNPVVFYSLAVGNFDLIPLFFLVLSFYLTEKKFLLLAATTIGIGAAYKMFPLIFLPFLMILGKNIRQQLKILLLGLMPLVLSIVPFLSSSAFRSAVLFSPLTQKMLEQRIGGISLVLAGMVILYGFFSFLGTPQNLWRYYLMIMLVFFSFTYFHLQWFVWLMPFLIIEETKNKLYFAKLAGSLVLCWFILVAFASADLHLGLLVPLKALGIFSYVTPSVTQSLSPATIAISRGIVLDFPLISRSIFMGLSLALIYFLIKSNQKINQKGGI